MAERRGQEAPVTVSVRELQEAFPDLSEPIIRARLKDRCGCVPCKARSDSNTNNIASNLT